MGKGTDICYLYMWCIHPNRNSVSRIEKVGHTWLMQERIGENISATGLHSSKDYKENTDNFSNFASDVGSASVNTEIIQLIDVESTPVVEKSTSIRESIIRISINLTQVVFPLNLLQTKQQLPINRSVGRSHLQLNLKVIP